MNAIAAILASLKTWPEPPTLELDGKEILEVAELHARLGEIGQVVSELKKIAALDLAARLDGRTFRYGESIIRPSFRGAPKIKDAEAWWAFISDSLEKLEETWDRAEILNALYPASSVRLTAIPKLAEASGMSLTAIKDTFLVYDPPTAPLSVMPMSKAPKFLQDMEEGEIR